MPTSDRQLPIPPAAKRDSHSREMIRAWVAEQGLHCSLNIGTDFQANSADEKRAWGILLADVARHVANAFEEMEGADAREIVETIRDEFNGEIDRPTSKHLGKFTK